MAKSKAKSIQYYEAVGRRKEAVARVRLYLVNREKVATVGTEKLKAGTIVINGKPVEQAIPVSTDRTRIMKPFETAQVENRFVLSIITKGGGKRGQLDAIIHGLSQALSKSDTATLRPLLKKEQLLTRDARVRERRKVGTGGKARRQKQSPKR